MITLHEEIMNILKEKGNTLTTKELAIMVNQRGNYRKRDGSAVTDFQIHGRTKNYPEFFDRSGSTVKLRDNKAASNLTEYSTINKESKINEALKINEDDDVSKIEFLIKSGFTCLGTMEVIMSNGLPAAGGLNHCGLYAITKPENYKISFLTSEETSLRNNVISPWNSKALKNKWVEDSDILYYGIAGKQSPRSLKNRLGDLIQHCKGNTSDRGPHKGGEIIWQLDRYESFSLWILPMDFSQGPRISEEKLLRKFYAYKGKLPFANRQF